MYFTFNSTTEISDEDRRFSGVAVFIISFISISLNIYILSGLFFGFRFRSAFFAYCTSKSIGNISVSIIGLVWISPSILKNNLTEFTYLNSFITQFFILGIYMQAIVAQTFLTINRFFVICSSGGTKRKNGDLITLGILSNWFMSIFWTLMGFPDCSCSFSSQTLSFVSNEFCHLENVKIQLYFIFILLVSMNIFNLISILIVILGGSSTTTLNCRNSSRRKRRNGQLLLQVALQIYLYTGETIAVSVFHNLPNPNVRIAVISTFLVAMLDGFIMFSFNHHIKPECLAKRNMPKKASVISISVMEMR